MKQTIIKALGAYHTRERSDFDLNRDGSLPAQHAAKPAAVLVPLVMREPHVSVLLTRRAPGLTAHAGQISFPGGRIDPGDKGPESAALRETFEETGISQDYVELCGRLDTYKTVTGYSITPVVGLVRPGFRLVAEPGEVDEIFEVPLDFVLDRNNHRKEAHVWKGKTRYYYAIPYGSYYIWGATAAMLVNLSDIMSKINLDACVVGRR